MAPPVNLYRFRIDLSASLEERLVKDNEWSVLHDEGTLTVSVGDESFACELARHQVKV